VRRYDYSFIKETVVPADIMSLTNRMAAMKEREQERKKKDPKAFAALESIAKIESVKGSNAIEGIVTTDKRIEEIVSKNSAPLNHSEMEIAGYRDVLNLIHANHDSIVLNEDTILSMHRMMMSYMPRGGGAYKKDDNMILNVDGEGRRSVGFMPVSAGETPGSMEQLILAYIDARDSGLDPLILIPCFVLDFLCIHPFQDGNGRMSRLLSLLLMYKSGIDVGKYISFEGQINGFKGSYYESLKRSSKGWHENANDYIPFIEHFILMLFTCYKELDMRFTVVGEKRMNKGNRIEGTFSFYPISKMEIRKRLPDVSSRTIEVKLSELLKEGKIEKIGTYKDARYVKKK